MKTIHNTPGWKHMARKRLLPLVKNLGGGLKTKSICASLIQRGYILTIKMLKNPEVLKCSYEHAKNGLFAQRRALKRRTKQMKAEVKRKAEGTAVGDWEDEQYSDKGCSFGETDSDDWEDDKHTCDHDVPYDWEEERMARREIRCGCSWSNHSNPYFCDDNWRQREHDSEDAFRRAGD